MNRYALKLLMLTAGLNQSDIAEAAGVTRQAVSLWLGGCDGDREINIKTKNLIRLADNLSVDLRDILMSVKISEDTEYMRQMKACLLWDRLYPSLESFLIDVSRGKNVALARLVQVFGLYESSRIAGKKIWKNFNRFKKYINPVRRRECENIWNIRKNLILN